MANARTPSRWLSAAAQFGHTFKPTPGGHVAPHLRLVRPVTGARDQNVWVADHLTLDAEVAVKFAFTAAGAGGAAAATGDRFLQQARSTARIADPHLVQLLEHGSVQGVPFAVMELLEGQCLRQRLAAGPVSLVEAHAVLSQTAGVLAKAHPLRLLHGSICPDHLFLTEAAGEPFVKISSFGASRMQDAYLCPEQILRGPLHGALIDAWALAVTVYELLTTTLPFEASSAASLHVAICNAEFSPPSHYRADVPAAVDAWFARVWARDPARRMTEPNQLAREFALALRRGSFDASAVALEPSPAPSPPALTELAEEDDERTVRWEPPSQWAEGAAPIPALAPHTSKPAAFPAPASPAAPRSLPSRRAELPSGPPPLPDARPSSPPPPPFRALSVSVPAATRTVWPEAVPAGFGRRPGLGKARSVLVGAAFGGGAALLAWSYQNWSDARSMSNTGSTASASITPATGQQSPLLEQGRAAPLTGIRGAERSFAESAAAGTRLHEPDDLPVIVQTDELPTVPDEPEARERNQTAGSTDLAGSAVLGSSRPRAPSAPKSPRAAPSPPVPQRAAPPSAAEADCNPPYYFDRNNIRRLKLECL